MVQLLEGLASLRTKIQNFLHYEPKNSHNKIVNNFYGPVNYMAKLPKQIKVKDKYLEA